MAYTSTEQGFRDYISKNKPQLDPNKLADLQKNQASAFSEWQQTGSIGSNYFTPKPPVAPITTQPVLKPNIEQKPVTTGTILESKVVTPNNGTGTTTTAKPVSATVTEVKPTETVAKVETVTTKPIETTKPVTTITKDTNWSDIPEKSMNNLEQLIEARYGTIANQKDGKLYATINGENYEWAIGQDGDPVKTKVVQTPVTTSPDDFFGLMMSGQKPTLEQQKTPEFKKAKVRFDKMNKFLNMDTSLLQVSLNNGDLIMGSQTYNDITSNPEVKKKVDEAIKLNSITGEKTDFTKKEIEENNKINNEITEKTSAIFKIMADNEISQEEYLNLINTDEVKETKKIMNGALLEYTQKQEAYNGVKATYDDIRRSVEEQYKRTGATRGEIEARIGEQSRKILPQLNALNMDLQNSYGIYSEYKSMYADSIKQATGLLELNLSNYYKTQDRTQKVADLQEQRAYEEAQTTKQLEQQYTYTYGDINSENPTLQNIAIERAVTDLYAKYPIPGMESQAMKVAKVQERIAQGMTGSEAIASVEAEIRGSQRYADYLDYEKARITPQVENSYSMEKVGDVGYIFNKATGEYQQVGGESGTPQGLLDYISASEGTHGNYNAMYGKGGQTAINLTGMTINEIQDLQKKSIYKDKNGNYIGGAMGKYQIVSGTLNGLKKRLGLTGDELFDEEMQDRMAMALIGNSYQDYQAGKITAEQLQNKVSGIWAGVPNTKGVSTYASDGTNKAKADNGEFLQAIGGTETTGLQSGEATYSDQQIGELAYLVELQEKNPTQASKDMKDLGYGPRDLANYKAGNMPLTEKQKNSSVEVLSTITDLITNYQWNDAVGKFDPTRVLGLQDAEDAKIVIDNLIAKMTLPNLGVLKGPMSDKDIEFIKQASAKLGTTQSNKSFEKNIIEAYNLSARRAGLPEIKSLKDIGKTSIQTTSGAGTTEVKNGESVKFSNGREYKITY